MCAQIWRHEVQREYWEREVAYSGTPSSDWQTGQGDGVCCGVGGGAKVKRGMGWSSDISVRGIRGKRPARTTQLGRNDRVAAERAPRARERFRDPDTNVRVGNERQREGVIAGPLIDAAREALISPLEDPADKTSGLTLGGRPSHAQQQVQLVCQPTAEVWGARFPPFS